MTHGLLGMLSKENIYCGANAADWIEAVRITGGALENAGLTEGRYTEAMRELIEKSGPYLVIAPGIALLHARPEDGVLRPGIVLLTLSKPVEFGHSTNDPVWLLFGLAADTNKGHIEALSELALMLSEPGAIEALQAGKSSAELIDTVRFYLEAVHNSK